MTEFKIGDKVQVQPDCNGSASGREYAGKVGTIQDIKMHPDFREPYVKLDIDELGFGIWMNELQPIGIVEDNDIEYID